MALEKYVRIPYVGKSLRFITFGGRLAHLAYHVHESGRKSSSSYS